MVEKPEKPEKVTFRFEKDPDYRFVAVNGAWGGPTSRGDIRVDFFYEHLPVPESITQTVSEQGKLGEEVVERRDEKVINRTLVVGMMLTPEQAESIGRWLQEKARDFRAIQEAIKRDEEKKPETKTDERDAPTTH